ncbi:hypothetical protein DCAR_0207347 [Daucus carota subsp. sativus]|uniref:Uncharacterized protein n=1 Tax=Daucus carota subsp. sativus TaxID=79200 RepID=A0A161X411_DAUCS|nr:hypothetical protein DCAR_0207347 [Daucus carota subsp. sativus]
MGNCSIKSGVIEKNHLSFVRIVMDSGNVVELEGPKLVREVVDDYPGYGIFKKNCVSSPLPDQEKLLCGSVYYLLPVGELQKKDLSVEMRLNEVKEGGCTNDRVKDLSAKKRLNEVKIVEKGQIMKDNLLKDIRANKRLNEIKLRDKGEISKDDNLKDVSEKVSVSLNEVEPVRMSSAASDIVTSLAHGSGLEVLPPPQKGIWRVKLMINTKQLEEIFSEDVNTEALIEQMRMAAASGHVTPRRAKRYLGLILKPILSNVFRAASDRQQDDVEPMELCISSPIKG